MVLEKQNLRSNSINMKLDKTLEKKKKVLCKIESLFKENTQISFADTRQKFYVKFQYIKSWSALLTYQFWMSAWSKHPLASSR